MTLAGDSSRVACRRWMVPYDRGRKSCTAGADSSTHLGRRQIGGEGAGATNASAGGESATECVTRQNPSAN